MPYITKDLQDPKATKGAKSKQWNDMATKAAGKKSKPTSKAIKKSAKKK